MSKDPWQDGRTMSDCITFRNATASPDAAKATRELSSAVLGQPRWVTENRARFKRLPRKNHFSVTSGHIWSSPTHQAPMKTRLPAANSPLMRLIPPCPTGPASRACAPSARFCGSSISVLRFVPDTSCLPCSICAHPRHLRAGFSPAWLLAGQIAVVRFKPP